MYPNSVSARASGTMMAAGEIELHQTLIQHIQSLLLNKKEAARTSVLSKSWLSAWHTRPNLDFDHRDFDHRRCDCRSDSLLDYAEKTIRRYEISNLMIDSFSLRIIQVSDSSRYNNLILRALKLRPTRLAIHSKGWFLDVPKAVFASENLVALTLEIMFIMDPGTVACSSLRSLAFIDVLILSPDVLCHVLSICPLIEKLSLTNTIKLNNMGGVGTAGGLITLHRLTSLVLDDPGYDALFLNALSSKFPSLKDLTIWMHDVKAQEEMLISSPSLERLEFMIVLKYNKITRIKFDLPSICKLSFGGSIYSLSAFRSNSTGWEVSDASVTHHHPECLTANNINFLGVILLQGLNVRISNLKQLMYNGLNDLKEARAQIFDQAASMWRDVPLLDDSTIPKDYGDVRFRLIWKPNQKSKLN